MTNNPTRTEAVPGEPLGRARERLELPPLTYLEEGDEVTVGRPDRDEYIVLPADAAALLRRLGEGASIQEAADWYVWTYGEAIDVESFVDDLGALGFTKRPGKTITGPVRWQRLGTWLFSPISAACYLLLVTSWLVVGVRTPRLLPQPQNLFFVHYISLTVATLFITQLPLVLLHEMAHALAARRLGLRSRLSIGRRLYFVVFQTTMNGLVSVPRSKRYLPILAGMLTDVGVIASLSLAADILRQGDGTFGLAARYCLAVAYLTALRVLWQLWFFLQTDIYYLVVTVCGCIDLQSAARQTLRNRLNRLLGKPPKYDPSAWSTRDASVAKWYSWLILAGYTGCFVSLIFTVLPAVNRIAIHVFQGLAQSGHRDAASTVDSAVFLGLIVMELAISTTLYLRERRNRQAFGDARPNPA
ncbi:MAG TPA: hypothetical protein VMB79_07310 [Jatrophihabitans sp.]|nr:hypothetical protein [Jatrophihabitans sp.]